MKPFIYPFLLITLTGCSAYDQAELGLLEQTKKGLDLTRQSQQARSQLVEDLYQLRRELLDEAFDDDTRAQQDLLPDWVITARKAYAAGLDQLARQRIASAEAQRIADRNLAAIDAALDRLRSLVSVRSAWIPTFTQQP